MNNFFKIAAVAVISFFAGAVTSTVLSNQTKSLKFEFNSNDDSTEKLEGTNTKE